MPNFLVKWEINVDADDHVEAARKAFEIMQRQGTTANVFGVIDEAAGTPEVKVDLEELDEASA